MTIFHNFMNRPVVKQEKLKKGSNVDTTGYIPLEKRIKNMMICGERLIQSRADSFDIPPDSNSDGSEVHIDPTRKPGIDLADVSALMSTLNAKKRADREAKKASGKGKTDGQGQGKQGKDDGKPQEMAEVEKPDKGDSPGDVQQGKN